MRAILWRHVEYDEDTDPAGLGKGDPHIENASRPAAGTGMHLGAGEDTAGRSLQYGSEDGFEHIGRADQVHRRWDALAWGWDFDKNGRSYLLEIGPAQRPGHITEGADGLDRPPFHA